MANIEISTFTRNNDGNTYVVKDTNAIPKSGGAVMSGAVLGRTVNTSEFRLDGGTGWGDGASMCLRGNDRTDGQSGTAFFHLASSTEVKDMIIYPTGTWTWSGTACQITSDQRYKQQITQIDNALLDAWEDVDLVQFKYNDAVNEKGDNARLHTGYVVQQIDTACKSHSIDISEYGLYCHEEYPEETEEVEVEQEDGTIKNETKVIREASEHYSLRYTETLVVECAYLRKKNKDLENSVLNLQTEIADLKSVIAELKTAVQEIARK